VSTVKGYGEYANFFSHDWMVHHVRIEMFTGDGDAARSTGVLSEAARSGVKGDGIIAVGPVDSLVHIRSRESGFSRASAPDIRQAPWVGCGGWGRDIRLMT
jgi:nitrogen regulatory protein PII